MIDILKAKKAFKEYVKDYDIENKQISLKISHIERTSQIAKKIAESLNLDKEDVELAELIGLLHDIGRFEQIKKYHTFVDKNSINHGEYGVKILFEDGKIRNFIETSEFDDIISKAIINHNRNVIEDGLTKRQELHSKIIRDADKTDIFYVLTVDDVKTIYETKDMSNEKITDEIYREFIEDRKIDYNIKQSAADTIISHFAYVFDFYFDYGLRYIYDKKYIQKLYKRFSFNEKDTMNKYNNAYEIAIKYVKEKLGE